MIRQSSKVMQQGTQNYHKHNMFYGHCILQFNPLNPCWAKRKVKR